MKFLETNSGKDRQKSITQADVDNKMMAGSRPDQKDTRPRRPTPPNVLKLGAELHVDMAKVPATGEGGVITEEDVRTAAQDSKNLLPAAAKFNDVNNRKQREQEQAERAQKANNARKETDVKG